MVEVRCLLHTGVMSRWWRCVVTVLVVMRWTLDVALLEALLVVGILVCPVHLLRLVMVDQNLLLDWVVLYPVLNSLHGHVFDLLLRNHLRDVLCYMLDGVVVSVSFLNRHLFYSCALFVLDDLSLNGDIINSLHGLVIYHSPLVWDILQSTRA